jgi:hypothetical protein
MRFKFTGPEGAVFAGQEYPGIGLDDAELEHVAALQRGTGKTMKEIMKEATAVEVFGLQCGLFLTLHSNNHPVSFDVVKRMRFSDFDVIEEPGDNLDEANPDSDGEPTEDDEDPTTPSTASDPADDGAQLPAGN